VTKNVIKARWANAIHLHLDISSRLYPIYPKIIYGTITAINNVGMQKQIEVLLLTSVMSLGLLSLLAIVDAINN